MTKQDIATGMWSRVPITAAEEEDSTSVGNQRSQHMHGCAECNKQIQQCLKIQMHYASFCCCFDPPKSENIIIRQKKKEFDFHIPSSFIQNPLCWCKYPQNCCIDVKLAIIKLIV